METKYLLCVTKAKPYLFASYGRQDKKYYDTDNTIIEKGMRIYNGKIIAEFEGNAEKIIWDAVFNTYHGYGHELYNKKGKHIGIDWHLPFDELLVKSCLTDDQLDDRLQESNGYAIHIKNLNVFNKPLKLSDVSFKKECKKCSNKCLLIYNVIGPKCCYHELAKAPQNMAWVWYKGERYCLITFQSQDACKILNGEKTIEVRKKILKGML